MAHVFRNLLLALAAGAAGGAAATVLRRDGSRTHPVAKSMVRAGLVAFSRAKSAFGEFGETMSDIIAEARSDIEARDASGSKDASDEHVVPFETRGSEPKGKMNV